MAASEEGTQSGGYARGRVPSGAVSLNGTVDEYKTGTKAVAVVAANVHNNYVQNFRMELKCKKRGAGLFWESRADVVTGYIVTSVPRVFTGQRGVTGSARGMRTVFEWNEKNSIKSKKENEGKK